MEASRKNIRSYNPDSKIKLVVGDGRLGYLEEAPYDAIHVGAAANPVPKALLDQLSVGGCLFIPVGAEYGSQMIKTYVKRENGSFDVESLMGVRYVPLTDAEAQYAQ